MRTEIGVALIGTGLMGRMHSHALRVASALDPRVCARLVVLCGRDRERREHLGQAFGWGSLRPDWQQAVTRRDVQLVIVATRNNEHAAVAAAALEAGKSVLCEKPLAASFEQAAMLRDAARGRGLDACAFNYRFVPALATARTLIERGELGEILHARSRFLLNGALTGDVGWRDSPEVSGSGVIGDLASHHIDLARWLVGEPMKVFSLTRALQAGRTEDSAVLSLELSDGASAVLEVSRAAGGHQLTSEFEIDGTEGTLAFALGNADQLVWLRGAERRVVATTRVGDPDMDLWWPAGHPLGWDASFVHQARHALRSVALQRPMAPRAASFDDGYRCAAVCEAALQSAASGRAEPIPLSEDAPSAPVAGVRARAQPA